MAIQDDILNIFKTIRAGGERATRRGEEGLTILDQLTPRERMLLETYVDPERFGSLEEAMQFDPLLAGRALDMYQSRVGTVAEPETKETLVPKVDQPEMPSGGLSSLVDTAPPTRGTPAPRTPVSVTALADPESMAGLLMAAPDEGSMARLREQFRRNVGPIDDMNEEMQTRVYGGIDEFGRRLPGAMQVQAEQEGVYGKREIPAAAGQDIQGISGREIGTSFGRRAASEQAEQEAAMLGLTAMPMGTLLRFATLAKVPTQLIEAAAANPAAKEAVAQAIVKNVRPGGQVWNQLLRQAGQRPTPASVSPTVQSSGRRLQEELFRAGQGKPVQRELYTKPNMFGMARGGNVRQAMIDRYNRMY